MDANGIQGRSRGAGSVSSNFMVNQDINSEYKIYRQYLISLVVVFYVIVKGVLQYSAETYDITNTILETDYNYNTTSSSYDADTARNEDEDKGAEYYKDMYLATFVTLFFAVAMTMYFYSRNKRPSPDGGANSKPQGAFGSKHGGICSFIFKTLIWQIFIVILYGLGALFFVIGFFSLLDYYFDEDYSTLQQVTIPIPNASGGYDFIDVWDERYFEGVRIQLWAVYANFPMYVGIILVQYVMPKIALNIFEARMFLYSSVLCVAAGLWAVYFCNSAYYDADTLITGDVLSEINEEFRNKDEVTFHATAGCLIILCVFSALTALFAGYKVMKNRTKSDAYRADVYQLWCLLAISLFLVMICTTAAFGCASVTGIESFPHLWISVIMICTDVLL